MAEPNLIPPPIQKRNLNQAVLSAAQEGLWFLQHFSPSNTAYNVIYLFKFNGGVNRHILESSLNRIIQRHEILRTVYPTDMDGTPLQVIQPFVSQKLLTLDYSSLKADEKEKALRAYAFEQGSRPFDLQNGPVSRFALLHCGPEEDYLFFAIHHIAFDDWSRYVFIQDLLQWYEAYQSRQEPTLPTLPIQYSDYAVWQKEWISGETRTLFVQHWKSILSGELPILALSTDHPRQIKQTYHGANIHFKFSPDSSARIKEFCRTERLTPSHLFMAAYALFLMRYTGQEDIIIGCPFANRPRSEQGNLIGYFINTLPIRLNLGNNPSVRELLKQVRTVMLDASTWKGLPFDTLVAELAPKREMGHTPIYQAMINILNVPKRKRSIPGLEIDLYLREQILVDFDIIMELSNSGEHFNAAMYYNTDLFDESTILRMASHYQNILEEMLIGPDQSLSELEILSAAERQKILVDWNNMDGNYPLHKCIHQLFEEQVGRTPDATALVFENQQLTYQELNIRANQLAHYLVSMGVGPEVLVGICLDRSLDVIVGLMGIQKAGGAYLPIDPAYPPERIAFMLEDSHSPVLITHSRHIEQLSAHDARMVLIDKEEETIARQDEHDLPMRVRPDNLAYVMYTSGSTGKPKGTMNTHKGIVNYMFHMMKQFNFGPSDRVIQFTPISFDSSVWNILGTLSYGGTLFFLDDDQIRNPDFIYSAIIDQQATYINPVPTMLRAICESALAVEPKRNCLRLVSSGGEVLREADIELAHRAFGGSMKINNQYGPTECSISAIHYLVPDALPKNSQDVPIGKPISNARAYVLDDYLHPVPLGVKGELFIGGVGVGQGYWNRSDLTAKSFLTDPFWPGGRMYRTGDIVRQLPDGTICFLGRSDNQVKFRSYRIELGEIEAVVNEFSGVKDSVVVLSHQNGSDRLVAFITVSEGAHGQLIEKLHAFLAERLPFYMLPSSIVLLESMPLTFKWEGKSPGTALPRNRFKPHPSNCPQE